MSDHLPQDRGMTGLGLLMQLGGTFFATMTAMIGFSQILLMSRMRELGGGDGGMTMWFFLLTLAGVLRALFHRGAGVELLYGRDGEAAIHRYVMIAGGHTLLWILFVSWKLDLPMQAWLPMAMMFAAWPVTLIAMLSRPSLRAPAEPVTTPDRGFEGLGVLMVILGLCGALFTAVMLLGIMEAGDGEGGLFTLFLLTLVMLVVRSLVHAYGGAVILGELTLDRVDAATNRYVNLGITSSVVVGAVFLMVMMSAGGGGGILVMPMIAGITLMLLAWPTAVRRLVTTRRMDLFVESPTTPALRGAPDRGLTALGWLLLAFGGIGLAAALPAALWPSRVGSDLAELTGMIGFMEPDPDRSPWLSVAVAGLQLWAGVELVLMSERFKWVSTAYAVTAVIVAIYQALPVLDRLDRLGGIGFENAGQILFASVAISLVVPLVTLGLVQRALPPAALPTARVFE